MSSEHPAREASRKSMEIVQSKGPQAKQRWLDLFADDGIVEDPIGPSPLDPGGHGHRGKEAIAAFWDMAIASFELVFEIRDSYACGNEVANVGSIRTRGPGGMENCVDGVFTYRVDEHGKISALRAFWEFERLVQSMKK